MTKRKCEVCEKDITTQNLPRHRKSRVHLLNVQIKSPPNKKEDTT